MMAVGLQHGISRRSFFATPVVLAASRVVRAADRRPNIVLIDGGTWRAQAVPWAGDPDVIAPNLARFAAQATTFSRAYCLLRALRSFPPMFAQGRIRSYFD